MNPHRPRRRRRPNVVEYHLSAWCHVVERLEAGDEFTSDQLICCGEEGRASRDRLESLIRAGGKRGRRVFKAVTPLDERFVAVTQAGPKKLTARGWWYSRDSIALPDYGRPASDWVAGKSRGRTARTG